jgi:hypothetical protein
MTKRFRTNSRKLKFKRSTRKTKNNKRKTKINKRKKNKRTLRKNTIKKKKGGSNLQQKIPLDDDVAKKFFNLLITDSQGTLYSQHGREPILEFLNKKIKEDQKETILKMNKFLNNKVDPENDELYQAMKAHLEPYSHIAEFEKQKDENETKKQIRNNLSEENKDSIIIKDNNEIMDDILKRWREGVLHYPIDKI